MNRFSKAFSLLKYLGPRWCAYRAVHALKQKTGLYEARMPRSRWEDRPLEKCLRDPCLRSPKEFSDFRRHSAPKFFFRPDDRQTFQPVLSGWDSAGNNPIGEADLIQKGRFRFFSNRVIATGSPPDWHMNYGAGRRAPNGPHWSRISDFGCGDIKFIWELSRFPFGFTLSRAYWRTGDDRFAELFWNLLEDWMENNPPQHGVNWKCGQEIAFRAIASCFALYALLNSSATTPERIWRLAHMIAVSGERIEKHFHYALSQRNNHGISEAMGLWTIGTLFPELRQSARWKGQGHHWLEKLASDLIYEDGSFVQHSANYHRLMLHDFVWVLRLGELNGEPFSPQLRNRVRLAFEFLYQIQRDDGSVPYFGQNDGALILPLNNCDYQDFRPIVQGGSYLLERAARFPDGPWNEDLLWLFGPEALNAPVKPEMKKDAQAVVGGYYTLRSGDTDVLVRAPSYRDRPADADALHVDLWINGLNAAVDAGTFSYNAPGLWENALSRSHFHNTVTVDGKDQMDRLGPFLWLPWLKSEVRRVTAFEPELKLLEAEHDGYQRLKGPVIHRRAVLLFSNGTCVILDRLLSDAEHEYRLHWLFPDVPYQWQSGSPALRLDAGKDACHVSVASAGGTMRCSLASADEHSPRGWRCRYYQAKEPALSFEGLCRGTVVWFCTVFASQPVQVRFEDHQLSLRQTDWQRELKLEVGSGSSIVAELVRVQPMSCTSSAQNPGLQLSFTRKP